MTTTLAGPGGRRYGNKRVSYLALVEFLARNEIEWAPPSVEETVATIERVAAGRITERALADWLRASQPLDA